MMSVVVTPTATTTIGAPPTPTSATPTGSGALVSSATPSTPRQTGSLAMPGQHDDVVTRSQPSFFVTNIVACTLNMLQS